MQKAVAALSTTLFVLFATPAAALDPPARYDYPPNPPPIVRVVPTTKGVCSGNLYGCAFRIKRDCVLYVSATLSAPARAAVLRHERAHCNGWPAHHPL